MSKELWVNGFKFVRLFILLLILFGIMYSIRILNFIIF